MEESRPLLDCWVSNKFSAACRTRAVENPELSRNIHKNTEKTKNRQQTEWQKIPNSSEIFQRIQKYFKNQAQLDLGTSWGKLPSLANLTQSFRFSMVL